jgi:hypothetical protein
MIRPVSPKLKEPIGGPYDLREITRRVNAKIAAETIAVLAVSATLRHTLDLVDDAARLGRPQRAASYLVATIDDLAGWLGKFRSYKA